MYSNLGSFRIVEKETISTIDKITAQDDIRVDNNFRPFFTRKLAAKFNEEYPIFVFDFHFFHVSLPFFDASKRWANTL